MGQQAEIHQNHCPHGNWYFLPWHRAYLYAFEQICRELSGKPDFALPYWDWFIDRQLPVPFRPVAASSNVLDHPRPGFPENAFLPADIYSQVVLTRVLKAATFEEFGSTRPQGQDSAGPEWQRRRGNATELEFSPHNNVHTILSGDMASFMSPLDPIFWLHHCNLDRVWTLWAGSHPDVALDPLFLNMKFNGQFALPQGAPFSPSVADLVSTEQLGYRYEQPAVIVSISDPGLLERIQVWHELPKDSLKGVEAKFQDLQVKVPNPPNGERQILFAFSDAGGRVDSKTPVTIPLTASKPIISLIGDLGLVESGVQEFLAKPNDVKVYAIIMNISPPNELSTTLRIFVNCAYISQTTGSEDPHYVTTVSFFGVNHHDGDHGLSISVDLTAALGTLRRNGDLAEDQLLVQLQVAPAGDVPPATTEMKFGRVEAAIL
ncbi:tyrosinase family protein [Mesorhizobium sp. LNJC403B00]|uniref:tyrosinase family protein n=1 Tax=Mesorhizobium sp. LNJC403B00 TaxID=1287280 RepID=UPI000407F580|nr:tyrosinase family protein [Mesorhizobium sp. LNJC403B00]